MMSSFPFDITTAFSDFSLDGDHKLWGLSTFDALIKSIEIVRQDEKNYNENFGFSFENQVEALFEIYACVDLDKLFFKVKSIEPNANVLKEDVRIILKLGATGAEGVRMTDPLAFCAFLITQKYGIPLGDSFHLTFPFVQWTYEEIKDPRAQPNLGMQYKFFSESKIYKNLKNEYGIPRLFAILPSGQKYGGFVKAYLHVNYMNRANRFPERICETFLNKVSTCRTDFNSKIYSNEKRLEFFQKLDIKEDDCREWTRIFDNHFPQHKKIHKIFGQIE